MYIRWDDANSIKFNVSNGVRQGGILSPKFFNIYIKNLLDNFTALNLGCHFAGIFMGAFAYAYDIVLLVSGLTLCLMTTLTSALWWLLFIVNLMHALSSSASATARCCFTLLCHIVRLSMGLYTACSTPPNLAA